MTTATLVVNLILSVAVTALVGGIAVMVASRLTPHNPAATVRTASGARLRTGEWRDDSREDSSERELAA